MVQLNTKAHGYKHKLLSKDIIIEVKILIDFAQTDWE